MRRMRRFDAPSAFSTPIVVVRSKMRMSRPLIIVTPATQSMMTRITITFKSSSSSHDKTGLVRGLSRMDMTERLVIWCEFL